MSNANESPRGLSFLFDRNRRNVALSRAQVLSTLVGNLRLSQTSALEQMRQVNLFCHAVDVGRPARQAVV